MLFSFPDNLLAAPRKRHASEMSNPEIALYIEKEHLRDAEESDYMLMENLIQRRYEEEDKEQLQNSPLLTVISESKECKGNMFRPLRRSSAIEGDIPVLPSGINVLFSL